MAGNQDMEEFLKNLSESLDVSELSAAEEFISLLKDIVKYKNPFCIRNWLYEVELPLGMETLEIYHRISEEGDKVLKVLFTRTDNSLNFSGFSKQEKAAKYSYRLRIGTFNGRLTLAPENMASDGNLLLLEEAKEIADMSFKPEENSELADLLEELWELVNKGIQVVEKKKAEKARNSLKNIIQELKDNNDTRP